VPYSIARLPTWVCGALALVSGAARADNFIDHRVTKDTGGIYSLQDAVPISLAVFAAGCALWQGTEDRFGKTCWQAGEAGVASVLVAEGLQFATGRRSPAETSDPGQWFSGGKGSFPSTHVSLTTSIVTPFIYQYIHEEPFVAALAILPLYEMVARVKAQEHWQTDVLAGAALGFAFGAYESHRNNPLIFAVLPGGVFVGFHHSF
jgi:membrane-associated phospholipid phosphatase